MKTWMCIMIVILDNGVTFKPEECITDNQYEEMNPDERECFRAMTAEEIEDHNITIDPLEGEEVVAEEVNEDDVMVGEL